MYYAYGTICKFARVVVHSFNPRIWGAGASTLEEKQGEQLLQQDTQQEQIITAKGIKLAVKNQFMTEADWQVSEALLDVLDEKGLSQEQCSCGMHDMGTYKGDLGPVAIPMIRVQLGSMQCGCQEKG